MNSHDLTYFIEKLEKAQEDTITKLNDVGDDPKKKNKLNKQYKQIEKLKLSVMSFKTYLVIGE